MLFVANSLVLNGGTTFLLRMIKELNRRGEKTSLLVLARSVHTDCDLEHEIKKWTSVIYLSDFSNSLLRPVFKSQLGIFFPINTKKLAELLRDNDNEIHVTGIFGILFFARMIKAGIKDLKITVGIYQQNEFLFSSVNYYFSNQAKFIFKNLKRSSVFFFNEENKKSYSAHYKKSFESSIVIPVGVTLPTMKSTSIGNSSSNRIVSIGQLCDFKTYNQHIINMMPYLLKIKPDLVYEIYGDGPCRKDLTKLAANLGLANSVKFKGTIIYSEIKNVLEESLVFIGSGTAIIEASGFGIPSIIGIESNRDPTTYGLLSDVTGLTYNEDIPGIPKKPIQDIILLLMKNKKFWEESSNKCRKKAEYFSIEKTADGFIALYRKKNISFEKNILSSHSNLKCLFSLIICGIDHKIGHDTTFRDRHNQGTIA